MQPIVRETDIKTQTSLLNFGCLNLYKLFGFTHLRSYFWSLELMSKYTKNWEHPPKKMVRILIILKVLNSSPSQLNVFGGENKSKQ